VSQLAAPAAAEAERIVARARTDDEREWLLPAVDTPQPPKGKRVTATTGDEPHAEGSRGVAISGVEEPWTAGVLSETRPSTS